MSPRISRVTRPEIKAPDLTGVQQNIDIPRGAFGEDVGASISSLGRSVEFSAQTLNEAFARQEERRAITEANTAFKDVPINESNALLAAKQEAQKNPALLPSFQQDLTRKSDERMKSVIEGLSARARPHFLDKWHTQRSSLAKDGATWARAQEVVNGRNSMNATVEALLATSASRLADLAVLKQEISQTIFQAHAAGHLLNGRLQPVDPNVFLNTKIREVDNAIANSLVYENPALLRRLIKDGALPDLSDEDEKGFIRQSFESSAGIEERAMVTALDKYGEQNVMFEKKRNQGLLVGKAGYDEVNKAVQELQPLVDSGDEAAATQQTLLTLIRDDLYQTDDVRQASKDKNAVMNKLASIRMKEEIRKMGLEVNQVPDKGQQSVMYVHLMARFNEMVKEVKRRGKDKVFELREKGTVTRLSDILALQADSEVARQKGLISNEKHQGIIEDLLPIVREKIESKHFLEQRSFFRKKAKAPADIYSNAFTHVLETLKANPKMNTVTNQADALLFAYQIARTTDKQEEDDIFKRREAVFKIGDRALKELYRKLIPEINNLTDEEIPNTVIQIEEARDEDAGFQIYEDANGNRARVFEDGRIEEIP